MSFNALSLAKLGVGFGALAVASIGLLAPPQVEDDIPPMLRPGSSGRAAGRTMYLTVPRADGDSDDDELLMFSLLA
jgi:hypothetical protein